MLKAKGEKRETERWRRIGYGSGDKQFNVDLVDGSGEDMLCTPPA
jgi:hypothetical protein